MKEFFIKEGYIHGSGEPLTTKDIGATYWNEGRIDTSRYYQYSVYKVAQKLGLKKFGRNARVLDMGCGSGIKTSKLLGRVFRTVVGVDQPYIIFRNKERFPKLKWISNDLDSKEERIALPAVDIVICADVIEHMKNPNFLIEKIKNVMAKDSLLVISTPERDMLRGVENFKSPNQEHIREWNTEEFTLFLENNGFEILQTHYLHAMQPHIGLLYINFLRKTFKARNHCMTMVCKLDIL